MPVPYRPLTVANVFIERSAPSGVSHMKLQKLVYCAHGWWLAFHQDQLLTERPEVWKFGPVFPSLYAALSGFGSRPIHYAQSWPFNAAPEMPDEAEEDVYRLIDFVWGRYGRKTALQLSEMTHKTGTPWQIVAQQHEYRVPFHTEIPDNLVSGEFRRIAEREGMLAA